MPFSQQHGHGGDAQSSQTVAQLYDQITAQYSDVPPTTGQLSDALKHKLAGEGLLDIEVLLRYRSIRTLRALESMDTNEKSLMLSQTYLLYDLLGVFPSSLKKTLKQLFGDVPQQYMHLGSPWATQDQRTGHHLTHPLDDDTYLRRALGGAVHGAKEIIGPERYAECLRRLKRSDALIVASCLEAAEALAALGIRKEDVRDRERKEALKAAKKAVRDVLLWRCTAIALGLDSREALVRAFEKACRHTHCDENTVSQLTNGYRRIREELAGGPGPPILTRMSPERRTQGGSNSGQRLQQRPGPAAREAPTAAEDPKKVPVLFDPKGPNSSDPVLVQAPYACLPGLEGYMFQCEKPTQHRSLPPAQRSPGPRNRDAGSSLQLAQMAEMMKSLTHHLLDIKSQVSKLQQERDPFRPFPPIPYDDEESEDGDRRADQ